MLAKLLCRFGTVKQFSELQVLNKYLEVNKHPYLLVYFVARWNPACRIAQQHVELISHKYNHMEIIKIDSDVSPQITSHYNVRAEPEFVFCLQGDEIIRQTGINKEKLLQKCQMMQEVGEKSGNDITWTPFGTKFENFYRKTKPTTALK